MSSASLAGVACAVITVSDRSARGDRADATGPIIVDALASAGAAVTSNVIEDGEQSVSDAIGAAIQAGARVVITTGGTGVGPRDKTPEGTAAHIAVALPGIPELLRGRDSHAVPHAALSRGLAGLSAGSAPAVIVNLPGSPNAVESAIKVVPTLVAHTLAQVDGGDH